MTSSISRQLILWLAIPLMLLALCGALIHYFNNIAPSVISSDQRLKDASAALMAHVVVRAGKNLIESVITKRSGEEMKLKVGEKVSAVIKSTEVMLEKK